MPQLEASITAHEAVDTDPFILASPAKLRKSLEIYNDTTQDLYVAKSETIALDSFTVKLVPGAFLEMEQPYGKTVTGMFAAADAGKYAMVTQTVVQ